MKVAYFVPYNWGGMIHYTAGLANAVSQYAEVLVFGSKSIPKNYFSEKIEIVNVFGDLDISVFNLRTLLAVKNLRSLCSFGKIGLIDKYHPDLIHFTTPLVPPIPFFILLNKLDKKYPTIYTAHTIHQDDRFIIELINRFDCWTLKLIRNKKMIAHTQRDKDELVRAKIFPEKNIEIIPHGAYDLFNKYNHDASSLLSSFSERCIIFFGYIKKYKGLEYLIRATPYIYKEIPDIRVIIAGEGDFSVYNDIINGFDESTRNIFEIHNRYLSDSDVSSLFQRSSLVVLPYSQMTGQSGVINIAFSFGKPIVASNVWAFDECLEDGVTGYLVPPKDPEALAKAIIKILMDDGLRAAMGINAYNKSKELSWDNIAKKHIKVYENVLSASVP